MAKTATITLGGAEYKVHPFNIGELERVTEFLASMSNGSAGNIKSAFAILRIAAERADPKIEDFNAIEATIDEVVSASNAIVELAGLKQTGANPPEAGAP